MRLGYSNIEVTLVECSCCNLIFQLGLIEEQGIKSIILLKKQVKLKLRLLLQTYNYKA
jgi:hypothetical protein